MKKVQVLLVEWMGYPLFRTKRIRENIIECGLGNLLNNINRFDAGLEFECTVVINSVDITKPHKLVQLANSLPVIKHLLLNYTKTNSKEKYTKFCQQYDFVKEVIFRENDGQDIGAYNFFYQKLKEENHHGDIVFINSSVRGPSEHNWLLKYNELLQQLSNKGLCGISLNSHLTHQDEWQFFPHVQSFFIYTNMTTLLDVFPEELIDEVASSDKANLIMNGEVGISTKILNAGYGIACSAFPHFHYKKGDEWTLPIGDIRVDRPFYDKANAL